MQIVCQCPACQAKFKVDAKYAGKKARCPKCQQVAPVPLETAPAPAPAAAPLPSIIVPPIPAPPIPRSQAPPPPIPGAAQQVPPPPLPRPRAPQPVPAAVAPAVAPTVDPPPPPSAAPASEHNSNPSAEPVPEKHPPGTATPEVFPAFQLNVSAPPNRSAGPAPLPGAALQARPAARPKKSNATPLIVGGALAGVLFVAVAAGGAYVYLNNFGNGPHKTTAANTQGAATATGSVTPASGQLVPTGTLIVDWPEAERSGAILTLDGQSKAHAQTGELKYALQPGPHTLAIHRRGYDSFQTSVTIASSEIQRVAPQWQAAVGLASLPPAGENAQNTPSTFSPPPATATSSTFEFVSDEFVAAFVIHPERLLQSSNLQRLGLGQMVAMYKQWLDLRITQAVILATDINLENPMSNAAVIRFAQPVDGAAVAAKMLEATETRKEEDLSILVSPDGQVGVFQPNPTTLVIGPPVLLPQMAAMQGNTASDDRSPLVRLMAASDLNQDVSAVATITPMMKTIFRMVVDMTVLPPGAKETLIGLEHTLVSASFTADLSGSGSLRAVVQTTDLVSAGRLMVFARYFQAAVRHKAQSGDATDKLPPQLEAMAKGRAAFFDAVKISTEGGRLVVTLSDLEAIAPPNLAPSAVPPAAPPLTPAPPQIAGAPPAAATPPAAAAPLPAAPATSDGAIEHVQSLNKVAVALADRLQRKWPKDVLAPSGKPLLSWRVHLLKHLPAESGLYAQFHLNEPWDSPHNLKLLEKMPSLYRTTGGASKTTLIMPLGDGAIWGADPQGPNFQLLKDPPDFTLVVVEAGPDKAVPWTKPDEASLPGAADPKSVLGTLEGDSFYSLTASGRVLRLATEIPGDDLKALATPAGGESVNALPYMRALFP